MYFYLFISGPVKVPRSKEKVPSIMLMQPVIVLIADKVNE